jgi:two-component system, NarL family, nitrate/nitrite response regulator NarL
MITTVAVITRLRIYQELLSALIGGRAGFAVIAVSASVPEATEMLSTQRPDVALIDASFPGVWRVALAARQSSVRVIMFGLSELPRPAEEAEGVSCDVALPGSATSREVIDALEQVRSFETRPLERTIDHGPIAALTQRELEVLALVAKGRSNKEIASELTVSVPTVKTHVHNVLFKLGARRRADAGRLLHLASHAAAERSYPVEGDAELESQAVERRIRASIG